MKKIILGIIIGLAISAVIGVYATNTFNSKDISYTNDKTEVNNVQDAVDELYDKSLSEINTLKSELNTIYQNGVYLSSVAKVGDYVAYDAGTWTTSADKPTSQGKFGGYTKDQNKANSVSWCFRSDITTRLKGWQVYSIDKNTNTVTLIHAGQPECYYQEHVSGYSSQSVEKLNNRASEYLNTSYATSAHIMTYDDAKQNILRITGDYYYLATANDSDDLWYVTATGTFGNISNRSQGIRPIVVLKPNILTTGKGTDMVGQEAWTLVKP